MAMSNMHDPAPAKSDVTGSPIQLGEGSLTIDDIVRVARYGASVTIPDPDGLRRRAEQSIAAVDRALAADDGGCGVVYGVTTGFGGMSGITVTNREDMRDLQRNLIYFLKAGAGRPLPTRHVRAGMLLRARSFLHGASAIRWEFVERMLEFLNRSVTPVVREFGSIGASGDLVPSASVAAALIGLNERGCPVRLADGMEEEACRVLETLGLDRLRLAPKEGLALVNGTSMSSGIAANCVYEARHLFGLALGAHALMIQALNGMEESFAEYMHRVKPHPGQVWVGRLMRGLLCGSKLTSHEQTGVRREGNTEHQETIARMRAFQRLLVGNRPQGRSEEAIHSFAALLEKIESGGAIVEGNEVLDLVRKLFALARGERSRNQYLEADPVQDRYSLRCLAQYLGPVKEGIDTVIKQIEIEANSANDNPLVDPATGRIYHGGNFLGQYVAMAMDQLRHFLGLMAIHLDAQMSLLVEPDFSAGLPPSLVGNTSSPINTGLKGLQISANSIMPTLTFLGNPIADRMPTHAEQFNQNINSQSFASANLAARSVEVFEQYLALALMFGVQAVELRSRMADASRGFDPRSNLSAATVPLYEAVRSVAEPDRPPSSDRPYIRNDDEQILEEHIARISGDIASYAKGQITGSVGEILAQW